MATPKGNATAYQALKPVTYTIGDMFMKDVDEWVKQGQYEKAAKAKTAAENSARIDDWQKQFKIDPKEVEKNVTDAYVGFFNYTTDAINKSMERARSAQTDYERNKEYANASKLKQDYLLMTTVFGGTNLMKNSDQLNEKIAGDGVFEGDAKKAIYQSLQSGMLKFEADENENHAFYFYGSGNKDEPAKKYSIGELSGILNTDAETNYLNANKWNGGNTVDKRIKDEAAKLFTKVTKGDGNQTISEMKFDRDQAYKEFDSKYEFNANTALIDRPLYQYGWRTLGKKAIETEEDFKKVREAYIDDMSRAVPYEYSNVKEKTDEQYNLDLAKDRESIKASRRTGRGGSGNSAPKPPSITVTPNASITIQRSDGTVDYSNGTLLNLKNKEYIAAYKVPNSKGGGFHTEYFIVGKDENGRMATQKPTSRADAFARIQGYGYDPLTFDESVNRGTPVVRTNLKKGNKLGKIKYDEAYKPDAEEGLFEKYLMNGGN